MAKDSAPAQDTAGFTPGRWKVGPQNGHCGISVDAAEGARVATVYLGSIRSDVPWGEDHYALPENAEALANARLIAAAPDLLEALEPFVVTRSSDEYTTITVRSDDITKARAAIARAQGGAA